MSTNQAPEPNTRRFGVGGLVLLALLAGIVTVGIGVLRSAAAPIDTVPDPISTPATARPDSIAVHVSGAVAAPGIYLLASGARVVDAVAAAGGFGDEADTAAVNLARPATDGEQIHVPNVGESPAEPGSVTGREPGGGAARVNVNTADGAALQSLPGIGPALAERIVRWRNERGRFGSIEDLAEVPGIGTTTVENLRESATV